MTLFSIDGSRYEYEMAQLKEAEQRESRDDYQDAIKSRERWHKESPV